MLPFILFSTLLRPTFAESQQQWVCNSSDTTVSYSYCGKWSEARTAAPAVFRESFSQNPTLEGRGECLCGSSSGGCWGLGWGWGGGGAIDHLRVWVSPRPVLLTDLNRAFLASVLLSLLSSQFQWNCLFQSPRPDKLVPPQGGRTGAASWWGFPLQSVVLEGSLSISVLGLLASFLSFTNFMIFSNS